MCGIAGIFLESARDELLKRCERMVVRLDHRGPDDSGTWMHPELPLAIGHTRLAIQDLSSNGRQPMHSQSGRFVISYNGEIYNFHQLRLDLQKRGVRFVGQSDTEVILEAFAEWGIQKTVAKLIGMFAIALWDNAERKLFLIRDRLGVKPMYWSRISEHSLIFSSELRPLYEHSGVPLSIKPSAFGQFLKYRCIPAPNTIFNNVFKLEPGTILSWTPGSAVEIERYWTLPTRSQSPTAGLSDAEALGALEDLLKDAVRMRLISDVPIGCLLSGGVDSALVATLMQETSSSTISTFSIGFPDKNFDESDKARAIAAYLGTKHNSLEVTAEDVMAQIPRMPQIYDEPFSDSSQIPSTVVSLLARQHVTVALSGDGGDEVFGGYERYRAAGVLQLFQRQPHFLRRWFSGTALGVAQFLAQSKRFSSSIGKQIRRPEEKFEKLARAIQFVSKEAIYDEITSVGGFSDLLPKPIDLSIYLSEGRHSQTPCDLLQYMRVRDINFYLPDDVLTKVDRASMAASLEVRVPLLDHRVVECMWHQPKHRLIRRGQSKWMLRQILEKRLPRDILTGPKSGFSIPLNAWLRGPLRDFVLDVLSYDSLRSFPLIDPQSTTTTLRDFLEGRNNDGELIWSLLMFYGWRASLSR